jgi:hypothetical protein
MSRIRSIHPGLWTDDAFMALSAHARLLVIGIWTEAFDDGVFEWKPLTLKARIFPADNVDVGALLDELVAGCFVRKEEVQGRQIGLVRNFREFQRPKKPNSSGILRSEWGTYVGIGDAGTEPVPHQFGTGGEKSPQMEEEGGRVEEESTPPPPIPDAGGARVSFDDVWDAYPQNPSSSESKARAAWDRTKPDDRQAILEAAIRQAKWFAQDCEERGRTVEAGLKFVPHLSTWLDSGQWREAVKLKLKGEHSGPVVPMVRLDRDKQPELWAECERIMGKKAPSGGWEWSFRAEIVEQARANLAAIGPDAALTKPTEAVH